MIDTGPSVSMPVDCPGFVRIIQLGLELRDDTVISSVIEMKGPPLWSKIGRQFSDQVKMIAADEYFSNFITVRWTSHIEIDRRKLEGADNLS